MNDDDDTRVFSLEPVGSLPLVHHEIIKWNTFDPINLISFSNEHTLSCYLNAIEPFHSSTSAMNNIMVVEDIKYLSQRNKNKKNKLSDGENHSITVSDPKIVKINDVSNGEKLFEALADEILDIILEHFQE